MPTARDFAGIGRASQVRRSPTTVIMDGRAEDPRPRSAPARSRAGGAIAPGGRRASSASSRRCSCSRRRCSWRGSRRARSAARRLTDVASPLGALVAVVLARAVTAWGFETAGRRAATQVVSQLRLDLVETRLRHSPTALDGAESAELATAAVSGVDALDATFARYLPNLVTALVVPVAVLALVVSIDPLAAGVMVLTLPLVPIFMWLVGRYTEHRARARWQSDEPAREPLPRRRPRAAHAAGVQPRTGAGRADRHGQRRVPARLDGDATRRVSLRRGARARCDTRDRARRRRRGRRPRGRQCRVRGRR